MALNGVNFKINGHIRGGHPVEDDRERVRAPATGADNCRGGIGENEAGTAKSGQGREGQREVGAHQHQDASGRFLSTFHWLLSIRYYLTK